MSKIAIVACTKRALRREQGYADGHPAPIYILCGCGNKVWLAPPTTRDVQCVQCQTRYDAQGYIIGEDASVAKQTASQDDFEAQALKAAPQFRPLVLLIGDKAAAEFMYMGSGITPTAPPCQLHGYKHINNRRYIHISVDNRTWQWNGGVTVGHGTYTEIPKEEAIKHVGL